MKKIISIILVVSVCLSFTATSAFAADDRTPTQILTDDFNLKYHSGDIDGDQRVTTADASEILKVAAKLQSPRAKVNYDLDGDGVITTKDARFALRVSAGLEVTVTNQDIFEYFREEINTIKSTCPGFEKKATATCKSATITIKADGLLGMLMNVNDMEYDKYIEKNKDLFLKEYSQEEYDKMLADAKAIYKPQTQEQTAEKGNSSAHLRHYPVSYRSTSCRLNYDDIKSIKISLNDGYYTMVVTMKNYSYNQSSNPYPATTAEYQERENLPYGKAFTLPEFNDTNEYSLDSVDLQNGKITLKVDAETGEIISSDYSYTYTARMSVNTESSGAEVKTTMKQIITLEEGFKMNTSENVQ